MRGTACEAAARHERGDLVACGITAAGSAARDAITSESDVFVSAVSAFEITAKMATGKLRAPGDLAEQIAEQEMIELPVSVRHGLAVRQLPLYHRDPFDRLLIAQARCEGLTIVTADKAFAAYDVPLMPA